MYFITFPSKYKDSKVTFIYFYGLKVSSFCNDSYKITKHGTRIFFQRGGQSGANIFFTWNKVYLENTHVI